MPAHLLSTANRPGASFLKYPFQNLKYIFAFKLDLEFGVGGDVDLAKRCAGKKVIIVGLPGAFTPT